MSNLLAQNKEIKRLRKEAERRKLEDEEEKEVEKAVAKARVVEEFERVQNGNEGDLRGLKRKIDENEHGPVRYAIGGSGDKSKRHESEKNDSRGELPSFWVPSETPENRKSDVKVIKQHPTCPAAAKDDSHDFSLRTLISVKFSETSSSAAHDGLIQICPSCNKVLSNSTKAVLAKPCGHVLCQACSDKFQRLPEQLAHQNEGQDSILCYVCQEDITPSGRKKRTKDTKAGGRLKDATAEKGLVVLSAEGTGFAGGGKNIVKKDGVVFQC